MNCHVTRPGFELKVAEYGAGIVFNGTLANDHPFALAVTLVSFESSNCCGDVFLLAPQSTPDRDTDQELAPIVPVVVQVVLEFAEKSSLKTTVGDMIADGSFWSDSVDLASAMPLRNKPVIIVLSAETVSTTGNPKDTIASRATAARDMAILFIRRPLEREV